MKKNVFTSCAVCVFAFYSSCIDTKDTPDNYLDNKLIEGIWSGKSIAEDGLSTIDSTVYIFKDNKASYKFYTHVTGLDTLKLEAQRNLGIYSMTDSSLFFSIGNDKNCHYKLSKSCKDSLYIMNPVDSDKYWFGLERLKK
ncbi:MAG: hypothetical protein LBP83_03970 [Dysgonamonadaceae bacterium]|jgi:hypothetical protein|nr:hypothetical protein [Dysgonamonadaceae bacterium]